MPEANMDQALSRIKQDISDQGDGVKFAEDVATEVAELVGYSGLLTTVTYDAGASDADSAVFAVTVAKPAT